MVEEIDYSISAKVPGGPNLVASDTLSVVAYDMIEVELSNKGNLNKGDTKEIKLLPASTTANFILIKAADKSSYGHIQYALWDTTPDPDAYLTSVNLEGPLMLIGPAVYLLKSLEKIMFSNTDDSKSATISILIGRSAT